MQTIRAGLASLSPGAPVGAGRLTMVALAAREPFCEDPYLLLDEAIAGGQLEVSEVSDAGVVAKLLAVNHSDNPILLFDGEELRGAKQNRIINATILVPARTRMVLPVSCVEQGRWRYEGAGFAPSGEALFAKGRLRKAERMAIARRMQQTHGPGSQGVPCAGDGRQAERMFPRREGLLADFEAGQHAVWDDVREALRETGTRSASSAMHDSYLRRRTEIERLSSVFVPGGDQVGAVFCIDGRVAGIEVVGSHRAFCAIFPKIVRSYCLNALGERTPGEGVDPKAVEGFISAVADLDQIISPSLGLGQDVRLDGPLACGAALIRDDCLVHLSAFSKAAFGPA